MAGAAGLDLAPAAGVLIRRDRDVMAQRLKLKQRRSQDRRERILAAATALFGERGIDATSLTDIAARAGLPLSSFYDYFEDKRALALAVPEANYTAFYDGIDALLASIGPDPVERLRAIYVGNFRYIEAHPEWGRVFFLELWPSVAASEARLRSALDLYGRRYVALIGEAVAVGRFRRDLDPRLAMSLLLGGMCHLTAVWLLYRPFDDLAARGEAMLDTLLEGFSSARAAGEQRNGREPRPRP